MISPDLRSRGGDTLHASATLLVALDGSPTTQAAASVAIQLARAQDVAIHGLYVVDERLVMDPYANSDKELGAKQGLTSRPELIARFEELGAVPELVVQAATDAELVTVGRRGLGHATDGQHLGRNLRAIARHVTRPILIGGDERQPIRRLLLVYDPSRRNQEALAWAVVFQHMLANPAIVLVPHDDAAAPHPRFSATEMQAHVEASGLRSYRLEHWEGSLAGAIVATADQNGANLIVIGERRHTVLARSLLGPVLDQVLRSSALPVLLA
jgi:nucleotide-binding universal stress UspA family protein